MVGKELRCDRPTGFIVRAAKNLIRMKVNMLGSKKGSAMERREQSDLAWVHPPGSKERKKWSYSSTSKGLQ